MNRVASFPVRVCALVLLAGCRGWTRVAMEGSGEATVSVPAQRVTAVQLVPILGLPWARDELWDPDIGELSQVVETPSVSDVVVEASGSGTGVLHATLWYRSYRPELLQRSYGWSPVREGDQGEISSGHADELSYDSIDTVCGKNDGVDSLDGSRCYMEVFLEFGPAPEAWTVELQLGATFDLSFNGRYLDDPADLDFEIEVEEADPAELDALESDDVPWVR